MCPDKLPKYNSPKVVKETILYLSKEFAKRTYTDTTTWHLQILPSSGQRTATMQESFWSISKSESKIKIYNTKSCDHLLIIHGSSHKTIFVTIIHFCSFVMSPLELSQFERLLYSHCCHISRIEWHCNIPLSNFMNRNQK